MNAVLSERESRGKIHMPADETVAQQIGELRAGVRHLESVVTDIKADLRSANQRIDLLLQRFDSFIEKVDGRFEKVDARFEKVDGQIASLKDALWSAKLWAIGLYVTQFGTLLWVMAHGFKWI